MFAWGWKGITWIKTELRAIKWQRLTYIGGCKVQDISKKHRGQYPERKQLCRFGIVLQQLSKMSHLRGLYHITSNISNFDSGYLHSLLKVGLYTVLDTQTVRSLGHLDSCNIRVLSPGGRKRQRWRSGDWWFRAKLDAYKVECLATIAVMGSV